MEDSYKLKYATRRGIDYDPLTIFNPPQHRNLPYSCWTWFPNSSILETIDKCHDRKKPVRILSLQEIKAGSTNHIPNDKLNGNWIGIPVDVVYGFEQPDKGSTFTTSYDTYKHLSPNRHFFPMYFLYSHLLHTALMFEDFEKYPNFAHGISVHNGSYAFPNELMRFRNEAKPIWEKIQKHCKNAVII
jgi:hypothetical protein